ncbi:RIP metalloprotease [Chloroflexota bacterium]
MVLTILSFMGVLIVLILVHELGHFLTAKFSGVKVEEFGLGFPPRLLSLKWGETKYSINAVLLGGFTKMAGEEDPNIPRSLASKSSGTRILVLSAGSLMNALLPLLLFSIAFMVPHNLVTEPVVVSAVAHESPAASVGIKTGDTLLILNGEPIQDTVNLHRLIQMNLGKAVNLMIQHSDLTTEEVTVIPRWKPPDGQGAIGINIDLEFANSEQTIVRRSEPFWIAIPMGIAKCIDTFVLFKNGLLSLIISAIPFQLIGPVGIAEITGQAARAGIGPLLEFAAFLSINLALVNIFPLPALDGGRIAFVLMEWIRHGKKISPKTEGLIHLVGFALLITLIIAITFQDIMRIISGNSVLP